MAAGLAALLCAGLPAQRGDRAGEEQPPLPENLVVPPAPVLDPEAALETIRVASGLRVELVASEPLVHDPIAMTFDARGRIWVVEMRGFMPDVDGRSELEPNGRVVVLEDMDGDGVMDESTVFLDGLVLPRAVRLVDDGVVVIEPPNMWFCRDTDGDGVADEVREHLVADGFDAGLENPEHAANGLMHGLDNWIYLANHPMRVRRADDGSWMSEPTFGGGQWGLTMDDRGRLFFNYNSDFLRADLYPSHYGVRHPHHGVAAGINQRVIADQSVWPARVTPGVNRGYQEGMLRDGVLTRTTAVCGPVIYRGHLLGEEFRGNAFICEPAGNLVRRAVLTETGRRIRGTNPYENAEFLTSTDERFRPVNLYNGPDGALYVVDMYRGILQHKNFVTTFLRQQILERELDTPLGLGRIYRIVPDGHAYQRPELLAEMPSLELVEKLKSPNGWTRDTAQQLLVERRQLAAVPALRRLVRDENEAALPRVHGLWALEGMGALTRYEVLVALDDPDTLLRTHGMRLAEGFLANRPDVILLSRLRQMAVLEDDDLALQLALSLGELDDGTLGLLADLAARHLKDGLLRSALLSGLHGREIRFLRLLLDREEFAIDGPGTRDFLRLLSRYAVQERNEDQVEQLLNEIVASTRSWQQVAMMEGMVEALPRGEARPGYLVLSKAPASLGVLARSSEPSVRDRVASLAQAIAIRDPSEPVEADDALTAAQRLRFGNGAALFRIHCAVCHQQSGLGNDGLAPPLRDTDWILGPAERPIRIVLQGMVGPIDVNGRSFDMSMPGHPGLNDEQIASILTYIRRAWNHRSSPVEPTEVTRIREATAGRQAQWTAAELRR